MLLDISLVGWLAVGFTAAGGAAILGWLIQLTSRDRLVRCPQTGGIAIVDIHAVASASGNTVAPRIRQCDLWPERADCTRACLVHASETVPGYPIRLAALRPFERPQPGSTR